MQEGIKKMYDKAGPRVAEAIRSRRMDAWYCSTAEEAVAKVLELIPAEDTVTWGGSMTLNSLHIKELLRQRGQKLLDRDAVMKDMDARGKLEREAFFCGTYLMSANAIAKTGELVNIDGHANRVAALCFGPERVIVIAGMNKVCPTVETALARARNTAAPANALRLERNSPCGTTGQCADCKSPECICNQIVITRGSSIPGRIKVVLVGEDLGL